MVVVALTSNPNPTDYSFVITDVDLEAGKLKRPSRVRVDKIYTLSQATALRTFGRVRSATLSQIHKLLDELITP